MPIIDSRLKTLGITLARPPKPVASYVPFAISGNQVFISGQVPISDGALKYVGKLGVDFSVEVGQAAAQAFAPSISFIRCCARPVRAISTAWCAA